jgi:hypothetical protein
MKDPDPINKAELERLLRESKPVPGTYPPVYMFGSVLIGYDKLEQIKILTAAKNEPIQISWLGKLLNKLVKPLTESKLCNG